VTLAGDEDLPEATITPGFAPVPVAGGEARSPAVAVVARPRTATAVPAPRKPAGDGGATLSAPMPGVILDIAVKTGDAVVRGQEIAVLDAMKMHNSVKSPRAGTIREVCVGVGQAVGHGDPIIRYEES
jgi:biotin carboxyl carrier protein